MKYIYWVVPMFSYGFYRGWRTEYKAPIDLTTQKILCSTLNGIIYASPMGVFKLCHLINRVEILLYKKNAFALYPFCYEEIMGDNRNVF